MPKKTFQQIKNPHTRTRSGFINTRRGRIKTPFFMPVATRGAVKGLTTQQVMASGTQVILANTYHFHIQPGEKIVKKLGGLHSFMRWDKPILTDSGGFQVFSLAKIREITEEGVKFSDPQSGTKVFISPEISIQIQLALGADIIMAFDDVPGLSVEDRRRSSEATARTHRWLQRCLAEFERLTRGWPDNQRPLLFGIAQGGLNKKLRAKSLEFVQSQAVNGIAIGGLSVGETRAEMYGMLDYLAPLYNPTKPHYLMGVGEPPDMRYAIERGIDIFDCVLPTRNGRHGSAWIEKDKKINLNNAVFAADPSVIDKKCDCYTCQTGYSRAFLRHLFKGGDPLAGNLTSIHNLRYIHRLCEDYQK